jgi:hypothetical protein
LKACFISRILQRLRYLISESFQLLRVVFCASKCNFDEISLGVP